MKHLNVFFCTLMILFFSGQISVLAQLNLGQKKQIGTQVKITSQHITEPLEVSLNKTVHLIFPSPVRYADRGSEGFMADSPAMLSNTIRLKASKKYFVSSNLTVATADGKLYHFLVKYADEPRKLRYSYLPKGQSLKTESILPSVKSKAESEDNSEAALKDLARRAADSPINLNVKTNWVGMKFVITGVYTTGDLIFIKFTLENKTRIIYDIEELRFYVQDKKQSKRTSSQELILSPLMLYTVPSQFNKPKGDIRIWGERKTEKVAVFSKFTIPNKQMLFVEVFEKGGGRNLSLNLNSSKLLRASSLKGGGN